MAERAVVARVVVGSIPTVHPRWACDLIGKGARLRPASWGFESSQAHWSHVTQLAEVSGSRPESCGFDSRRGYGHVGQPAESSTSRAERWWFESTVPTWVCSTMGGSGLLSRRSLP